MKSLKLLALFATLLLSSVFAAAPAEWLKNIKPLTGAKLIVVSDDGHDSISDAFRKANKSIQLMMYHLSDKVIVDDLATAQKRGVNVEVLLDTKSLQNPKYDAHVKTLAAAGVKIYKSSPKFSISHAKSFLVDGGLLLISTINFVGHFDHMRDSGIYLSDKDVIANWVEIFNADRENSKNGGDATPKAIHPNLVVSPTNSEAKLVDLINAATKTVHLTSENLGNNAVMAALANAEKRGVAVQVILPECNLGQDGTFNYPYLYALKKAGAEIKVTPAPYSANSLFMHQKMIVVDSSYTFLGSENFSYNSLVRAREVGIIFSDSKLVLDTEKLFQTDWQTSKVIAVEAPTNCAELTKMP